MQHKICKKDANICTLDISNYMLNIFNCMQLYALKYARLCSIKYASNMLKMQIGNIIYIYAS